MAGSSSEPVGSTPALREKLVKRRLALIWAPIVVCLALMLPSSTLAATGYTFKIVDQHCLSGGHNIYFRVSLTAAGTTAANKLTIKSTSQYLSGGTWHNFYKWASRQDHVHAQRPAAHNRLLVYPYGQQRPAPVAHQVRTQGAPGTSPGAQDPDQQGLLGLSPYPKRGMLRRRHGPPPRLARL